MFARSQWRSQKRSRRLLAICKRNNVEIGENWSFNSRRFDYLLLFMICDVEWFAVLFKSDCEVQFIIFCWAMCPDSYTSACFPRDGNRSEQQSSRLIKWPQEKLKAIGEQTNKAPYSAHTTKACGFLDNVNQQRETNKIDHNTMISLSFQLQKRRREKEAETIKRLLRLRNFCLHSESSKNKIFDLNASSNEVKNISFYSQSKSANQGLILNFW